ncbi:MAG: M81 family metallopeptidase [Alphaproteobacteria bacterium]
MARIAIGGFWHETNTFAPVKATLRDYEEPDAWPGLTRGPALLDVFGDVNIPIAGFISTMRHHDLAPLLWCSSSPSAHVEKHAYETIAAMLIEDLVAAHRAQPLDAIYLCLHGAMVAEHLEDGEGELLARIRAAVGDVPIVASLDLHANVTERMFDLADMLIVFRTYPHLDMNETGRKAAALLEQLLRDGRTRAKAFRKLPFLIPLTQQCTLVDPMRALYANVAAAERGAVESVSFACGFPPADMAECGPAILAYGTEAAAVDRAADALLASVLDDERKFAGKLWTPRDAVAHAIAQSNSARKPTILADTQDNPGAGANSDTVGILAELVRQNARGAVLGLLYDPLAADTAHRAGVGATIAMGIGSGSAMQGHTPQRGTYAVEALSDGRFLATGPFYGGNTMQLGKMAVLRVTAGPDGEPVGGGVRVVVASRKQQAADQAMFTHLGIVPAEQKILVLKSSVHFRADFQLLAEEVLVVAAPGPNLEDPASFPYRHLRRGVRLRPFGPIRQ